MLKRYVSSRGRDVPAPELCDSPQGRAIPAPFRAFPQLFSIILLFGLLWISTGKVHGGEPSSFSWQTSPWGRRAALSVPAASQQGFTLLRPNQTGVTFTNVLTDARAAENQIRLNGSGVALGDVDGDGWCDIYLCGLETPNRLYRNLGNLRFEDITAQAGVACESQFSTGAALIDVDGDGDVDLLANGIGTGTRLFLNDGKGRFTHRSGTVEKFCATTPALADVDGDGDLDLYVTNYRTETVRSTGMMLLRMGNQRMVRPEDKDRLAITPEGRVLEFGEPDVFYLNEGNGKLTPVPWTGGRFLDRDGQPLTRNPFDWGLTVAFRDINGDRHPDIYVCNDFQTEDRVWMNDGRGFFRPASPLTFRHIPSFSMCVDFADVDRDGFVDLMAADMLHRSHPDRLMQLAGTSPYVALPGVYDDQPQFDRNMLQRNNGDGTFVEIAAYAGVTKTGWNWEAAFLDVDLDGFEDLLCTTSHLFDTQDLDAENMIRAKGPWPPERVGQKLLLFPRMTQPKQAFRNRGDLTFEHVADRWNFNQVGVCQGMAFADLDNDGDQEVVVNVMNGAAEIHRNLASASRVLVRLKGNPPNTHGVGAKVSLIAELRFNDQAEPARFVQTQEICAGGRYLSSDEPVRVFATDVRNPLARSIPGTASPDKPIELKLEILWRSGRRTLIDRVRPNSIYEVAESSSAPAPPAAAVRPTLFANVSDRIAHRHHDEPFNEFDRQPLLPRKLSHGGPGVAWFDFDRDGHDDLIIGAGRGGHMAVLRGNGAGSFTPIANPGLDTALVRDQAGLAGVALPDGKGTRLLAASSNYEDAQAAGALVRAYDLNKATVQENFPGQESSSGAIALADVNGDGSLDLFVGGRCIPGKWPKPATSLLFISQGDRFELDRTNTVRLAGTGMVSGATFADVNGDGWGDLILACEWGPIRVYLNERGRLREATLELGLQPYAGWWSGVAVGDFDSDGRLDIAASNWGLNGGPDGYDRPALAALSTSADVPGVPLVYWGEFENALGMGVIEAEYDQEMRKVVPIRSKPAMEAGFPFVAAKFQTYRSYNTAAVSDLLGDNYAAAHASRLRAPWLASTVFMNRGARFEPVLLTAEAQFSPGFGICAADFDGDGAEDLFMAQNFFHVQPQAVRCDAGRSVLLKGDGRGNFKNVAVSVCGLAVPGEGRGAAVADFDQDGRVDLAVGQNAAPTLLFHNRGAKPGLRVRLAAAGANPGAVGAQVRLRFGTLWGPVREVQAGGGYWSQNSAVQLLGTPATPTHVWVRWPGAETNLFELPGGRREVLVTREGVAP